MYRIFCFYILNWKLIVYIETFGLKYVNTAPTAFNSFSKYTCNTFSEPGNGALNWYLLVPIDFLSDA